VAGYSVPKSQNASLLYAFDESFELFATTGWQYCPVPFVEFGNFG
jgi:hypothetical protein